MLTVLKSFMPRFKLYYYGVMVDWCLTKARYYTDRNETDLGAYWTKQGCKYLLKRLDALKKWA